MTIAVTFDCLLSFASFSRLASLSARGNKAGRGVESGKIGAIIQSKTNIFVENNINLTNTFQELEEKNRKLRVELEAKEAEAELARIVSIYYVYDFDFGFRVVSWLFFMTFHDNRVEVK